MITIKSLNEIPFESFTKDDLILFNLENTVFIESMKIMRSMNSFRRDRFIEDIRFDAGDHRVTFLLDNLLYQLVEKVLIDKLNQTEAMTMGITAIQTGYATTDQYYSSDDRTLAAVNYVGVKFNAPYEDIIFEGTSTGKYKDHLIDPTLKPFEILGNAKILNKILFCNNIDKGIIFELMIKTLEKIPISIILIDDVAVNITAISNAIERINTELGINLNFIGYHYTFTQHMNHTVTLHTAEIQKKFLLTDDPILLNDTEIELMRSF